MRVLPAGARSGEPELQAFVDTIDAERLVGTGTVAARVAELGALREGLSVERARDAIWTLNSVEVWSLLTEQRGWTGEEYEQWVGRAMADAVLAPDG